MSKGFDEVMQSIIQPDLHPELSLSDYPEDDIPELRLRKAGCDIENTPVDTFLTRPDFGFAYSQEEFDE